MEGEIQQDCIEISAKVVMVSLNTYQQSYFPVLFARSMLHKDLFFLCVTYLKLC